MIFTKARSGVEPIESVEGKIDAAYRRILGRAADRTGLAAWTERLSRTGEDGLYSTLLKSSEFVRHFVRLTTGTLGVDAVRALNNELFSSLLPTRLHPVRIQLVGEFVPQTGRILDLGGASSSDAGALVDMGLHGMGELVIVDLPSEIRMKAAQETKSRLLAAGFDIHYQYHSMADLSRYDNNSFDFVWSGQTIEHIPYEEARDLIPQIWRVLKRGGSLGLDTPTRRATRLLVGDKFIHAEHKYEYDPHEIREWLVDAGFSVTAERGLIAMTESHRRGYCDPHELSLSALNTDPEDSFCFFISAEKP